MTVHASVQKLYEDDTIMFITERLVHKMSCLPCDAEAYGQGGYAQQAGNSYE